MTTLGYTKIPSAHLPRSSHTLSLIGDCAYIFGGEIKPREPVDNAVHRINVHTGEYEQLRGEGDVPSARVGHAAATIGKDIYVFGGSDPLNTTLHPTNEQRGGKEMTALQEHGAIYRFSPSTSTWTLLSPPSAAPYPSARSYHCATSTSTHIIIHAGCAAEGRLNDLWAFNVASCTWTKLPDAPGDARGGAAIAYVGDKVYRMGGFNGKVEVGGGIDVFTFDDGALSAAPESGSDPGRAVAQLGGSWETISYGSAAGGESSLKEMGPGARSVTALLPLQGKLVSVMGEGKPSPTGGHDAAGNFWPDVWAFDLDSRKWEQLDVHGPEARGWFAADSDGERLVLWGGLNGANERLADGWVLA